MRKFPQFQKENSVLPCRVLEYRITKMSKSRYMNFLGILPSHPAVARKRHISCFSLLLYENRVGVVSDMYPPILGVQYWGGIVMKYSYAYKRTCVE